MKAFYDRLFRSQDLYQAFHEAQVEELRRWKGTGDISEAVRRAGAFILTR